jgi:hypothetical protein
MNGVMDSGKTIMAFSDIWLSGGGTTAEIKIFTKDAAIAPGAPTDVGAGAGNAEAAVKFRPPASNGGGPPTSYTVTSYPGSITATGAGSPILVTGLTNGTPYTFTVTATNELVAGPATGRPRFLPTA